MKQRIYEGKPIPEGTPLPGDQLATYIMGVSLEIVCAGDRPADKANHVSVITETSLGRKVAIRLGDAETVNRIIRGLMSARDHIWPT